MVSDQDLSAEADKNPEQTLGDLLVVHHLVGAELTEEILRPLDGSRQQLGEVGQVKRDFQKIAIYGNLLSMDIHEIGDGL
jgi:hypothetical protein